MESRRSAQGQRFPEASILFVLYRMGADPKELGRAFFKRRFWLNFAIAVFLIATCYAFDEVLIHKIDADYAFIGNIIWMACYVGFFVALSDLVFSVFSLLSVE
jgi:hypothetical protein